MLGIYHDSTWTIIIYGMANLVSHVAHDMNCHITKDSANTYRDWDIHAEQSKQEQLESLRSDDTPHSLMITRTIESYWIPSQKKRQSQSYKFKEFAKINFETSITRNTPSQVAW